MIAPNPIQPANNATVPGTNKAWKLRVAAVSGSTANFSRSRNSSMVPSSKPPKNISPRKRLIICSPWLTAMAKIRNGVSIFIGSMPKPISFRAPSIQITDTKAANTVSEANLAELEYKNNNNQVNAMVNRKNLITLIAPSEISPTILAKPIMCTLVLSFSYFLRIPSNCLATTL